MRDDGAFHPAHLRTSGDSGRDIVLFERREDGRILQANAAALKAYGYTREEMLTLRSSDLSAPHTPPFSERELALADLEGVHFQTTHRRRDGETFAVEVFAQVASVEGTRILVSIIRDISQRKRAEEALPESEERFRIMADGSPVIIWVTNVLGENQFVNRTYREYFGLSFDEVEGPKWQPLLHPEDAPKYLDAVVSAVRGQRPFKGEARVRRKDGEWRWIESHGEPRFSAVGEFLGHVGTSIDITERVQAMSALGKQAALLNLAHDAIFVRDARDKITFWNRGAEMTYGWLHDEAIGRVPRELLKTRFPAELEEVAACLVRSGRWEGELSHTRKDGREIVVASRWALQRDVSGRQLGVLEINRDITEQRRLEEQLKEAQKLESIGRLAGGIAHDFNNLLTVIQSCAETLKEDVAAGAPVNSEDIDQIHAAGRRASELTRQLLAFASRQLIRPVSLDLNALVRGTEKLLRRVLGEDIELVVRSDPQVWPVLCDPGQIEQVIVNLAVNAHDAMPRGGGRLSIEVDNRHLGEETVDRHPGARPGDYVRLAVHDSGSGMSPEVKAHIFEPFFTTKPAGQGTGLGLATVYGIVKQNEGHIQVDSQLGLGTKVEIFLPRTRVPVVPSTPKRALTTTGGHEVVMVVEDNPQVREVTVRALASAGYEVLVAANGRDALAMEPEKRVRLLVTDVVMPGLDGRALAEAMGHRHPGLRVLYVSGYAQDAIVKRGVLDQGIEFLPKPFTAATLLERVRAVLDARPQAWPS